MKEISHYQFVYMKHGEVARSISRPTVFCLWAKNTKLNKPSSVLDGGQAKCSPSQYWSMTYNISVNLYDTGSMVQTVRSLLEFLAN
jgi:hypothetical protein